MNCLSVLILYCQDGFLHLLLIEISMYNVLYSKMRLIAYFVDNVDGKDILQ